MSETINLTGKTKEVVLPSGHKVTLQEQNGYHDELLSSVADATTGMGYNKFVADIVIKTDLTPSGKLTLADVNNLLQLDFATIIIASRIHSIGPELRFSFDWGNGMKKFYVENLEPYLLDYGKPVEEDPQMGSPDYFGLACPRYPNGKQREVELTLTSGKKVKYQLTTRGDELKLLEYDPEHLNINTKLRIRNLQMEHSGNWVKVDQFRTFSSKDMREIRTSVNRNDPDFFGISEVQNPSTGERRQVSLLEVPDFFFPAEI